MGLSTGAKALGLVLLLGPHSPAAAASYQRHPASHCSAVSCHGGSCTGNLSFAARATLEECRALCELALPSGCACFEWRDPDAHHPVPQQPCCLTTNRSTAVDSSGYGYTAYVSNDQPPGPPLPPAPPPAPAPPVRPLLYTIRGAIEVDTNENTMFMWHEQLYVLENIPCYYSQHASRWDPRYANASYARIRRFDDGAIVVNISSSIGFGFVSAFVDEDHDTVWLFGSSCNRCKHGDQGCGGSGSSTGGAVQAWSNRLNKSSLLEWDNALARTTPRTYNVEVTRVRSTPAQQRAVGLPPHKYAMILEIEERFAINNNADGDLTTGWMAVPGAKDPPLNGGPSIRWNPLDSMYYAILGGHHVELIRTKDFKSWERSVNAPFIQPSPGDGMISPFAGFPEIAHQRGFIPMENTSRWDWNSNDADVCCMNSPAVNASTSYVIWGAGTQGETPDEPLTKANHCANVVAVANVSLPQLLADHFKQRDGRGGFS